MNLLGEVLPFRGLPVGGTTSHIVTDILWSK